MINIAKKVNSLGFLKNPKQTKVVVAMSGGVDSSTVAGLMKKEGYNVIGITLKLYDDAKSSKKSKQCCAGQDILDAKRVSQQLNINHKILYYQKKFKKDVIDSFVDSYLGGETPIPCVKCNQTVKFRDLYDYAQELNADALVTGHYVNRIQKNGNAEMYRAADLTRDQSYFLFATTQEQLNFLRFPLGAMHKGETRQVASELNLNVADKPDSQDICFVPNGNYASVINKYRPESFKEGDILDIQGKIIGKHEGIINFTIGQRKGIKISNQEPLYVVDIIAKENKVIVGRKEDLFVKKIYLKDINLLSDLENYQNDLFIKVRSTGKLIKAKILMNKTGGEVELYEDETGISPGQACVFYSKNELGDKVLGGGWITRTLNKYLSP
ncbi:MAG: tRNA 2-thiouridine(34) synthase MnmA [Candidatus Pelagibacterales bacterium]|nr:MAG: tRNA 2-thiouridine(34) synthase MnmA [Pelagibacterales bacterium]